MACPVMRCLFAQKGRASSLKEAPLSLQSRIESLKGRHATLHTRIIDEDKRPQPDAQTLTRLKSEKLRLKEELERLRQQ